MSGSRAASSVAAAIVFAWMVLAPAGSALAHGGPEKVVDGRFVVTLALAPTVGGTRLQFFFRDFASGRLVTEPVSFRVRVRSESPPASVHEHMAIGAEGGQGGVVHGFGGEGFHEVFIEFWRDREPDRVYRPDDWRVWIGGEHSGTGAVWAWAAGAIGVAIAGIGLRLRRRSNTGRA